MPVIPFIYLTCFYNATKKGKFVCLEILRILWDHYEKLELF